MSYKQEDDQGEDSPIYSTVRESDTDVEVEEVVLPRGRKKWHRPPLIGQAATTTCLLAARENEEPERDIAHGGFKTIANDTVNVDPGVGLSPTSIVSGEWDSGADVGYHIQESFSSSSPDLLNSFSNMMIGFGRTDPEGSGLQQTAVAGNSSLPRNQSSSTGSSSKVLLRPMLQINEANSPSNSSVESDSAFDGRKELYGKNVTHYVKKKAHYSAMPVTSGSSSSVATVVSKDITSSSAASQLTSYDPAQNLIQDLELGVALIKQILEKATTIEEQQSVVRHVLTELTSIRCTVEQSSGSSASTLDSSLMKSQEKDEKASTNLIHKTYDHTTMVEKKSSPTETTLSSISNDFQYEGATSWDSQAGTSSERCSDPGSVRSTMKSILLATSDSLTEQSITTTSFQTESVDTELRTHTSSSVHGADDSTLAGLEQGMDGNRVNSAIWLSSVIEELEQRRQKLLEKQAKRRAQKKKLKESGGYYSHKETCATSESVSRTSSRSTSRTTSRSMSCTTSHTSSSKPTSASKVEHTLHKSGHTKIRRDKSQQAAIVNKDGKVGATTYPLSKLQSQDGESSKSTNTLSHKLKKEETKQKHFYSPEKHQYQYSEIESTPSSFGTQPRPSYDAVFPESQDDDSTPHVHEIVSKTIYKITITNKYLEDKETDKKENEEPVASGANANRFFFEIPVNNSDTPGNQATQKDSLQDSLLKKKPKFVYHAETRRKCLAELADRRQYRTELRRRALREGIRNPASLNREPFIPPHPMSEMRLFTQKEMRKMTEDKYKKLEEVRKKKEEKQREEEYRTNRYMGAIFRRKLQRRVLRHKTDLSNSVSVITSD